MSNPEIEVTATPPQIHVAPVLLPGQAHAAMNAQLIRDKVAQHNIEGTPCTLPDGIFYVDISAFTEHPINNVWVDLVNCPGFNSLGHTCLYVSESNNINPYKVITLNGPSGKDYVFDHVDIFGPPIIEIDVEATPKFDPFIDMPLTYVIYGETHEVGSVSLRNCTIKGNFTYAFTSNKNAEPGPYEVILDNVELETLANGIGVFSSIPSNDVWLKVFNTKFLGSGTPVAIGLGRGAHVYAHPHVNLYFDHCEFHKNYRRCVQHRGTNVIDSTHAVAIFRNCHFANTTNIAVLTSELAITQFDNCYFYCSYQGILVRNHVILRHCDFDEANIALAHYADVPTRVTALSSTFKNSALTVGGTWTFHNCSFSKHGTAKFSGLIVMKNNFDVVTVEDCSMSNDSEPMNLQAFVYVHKGTLFISQTEIEGITPFYAGVLSVGDSPLMVINDTTFSLEDGSTSIPSRAIRHTTPLIESGNTYNVTLPISH